MLGYICITVRTLNYVLNLHRYYIIMVWKTRFKKKLTNSLVITVFKNIEKEKYLCEQAMILREFFI